MESTDQFATSKANLRDTVKWLATTIAAVAGLVVAGAPFSNFGKLEPFSVPFFVAAISVTVAAICLFMVWRRLLVLLRPDAVFPSQVRSGYQPPSGPDGTELAALKTHLAAHHADLLPDGFKTFDELEAFVTKAWHAANATPSNPALLAQYTGYRGTLEMYVNYATFARLHQRIQRQMGSVVWLTTIAAIALLAFAYVANSPKDAPTDRIVVVQATPPSQPSGSSPTALKPVRFEPGKAHLDRAGLDAIEAARTFLRDHQTAGLVLLAHTDTTGTDRRNQTVSAERGSIVRRTLLREGGIAPSRVFVAELPTADLPKLTLPRVPDADNRSVEFLVVTMPAAR